MRLIDLTFLGIGQRGNYIFVYSGATFNGRHTQDTKFMYGFNYRINWEIKIGVLDDSIKILNEIFCFCFSFGGTLVVCAFRIIFVKLFD